MTSFTQISLPVHPSTLPGLLCSIFVKMFLPIFDSIESAIQDIKRGNLVVVADDEDWENEGRLCVGSFQHYIRGHQLYEQTRQGLDLCRIA